MSKKSRAKKEEEALLMMVTACRILGWRMGIPIMDGLEDNDGAPGLIFGNDEFLDSITSDVEIGFEIYDAPDVEEN